MSTVAHNTIRLTVASLAVAMLAVACGGSDEEPTSDAGAATTADTVADTTTTSADTTTTADESPAPELEVRPFAARTLTPGRYRTTSTNPIFSFEVPDHGDDVRWRGRLETPWSITLILFSDFTPTGDHEPGLSIAVAEPGSTIDSVVAAMEASDPSDRYSFDVREGSFAGRDATVVTQVSNRDDDRSDLILVGTGEESYFNAMYAADRQSEHYVYELDGRIAIVTFEAPTNQVDMIAAEGGAILESMTIGESS